MGSTNQRPAIIELKIGAHSYPESKKSALGICPYFLSKKPQPFLPLFTCQKCGRENFDGGLCQKVHCACGLLCSRTSTEDVSGIRLSDFWNCFEIANSKRYAEVVELESITLGVFERGIPIEILQKSSVDFDLIFKDFVHPFFTNKMRCVSNKDYFKVDEIHFKVMNCVPEQGFVTRSTQIFCYKMLSERTIYKIEITPLAPHSLCEELFESLVLPYFQNPRHVHEDQLINIHGLDCIISCSEPWNGILCSDSQIEFSRQSFPPLQRIKLVPYFEDLPNALKNLDPTTLINNIVNGYLMPTLKGWNRLMFPGKTVSIAGIEFKVLETIPAKGVVGMETVIFYDGKGISRREERRRERASMPRNNRLILRQILSMLDSMRQLTEEFSETLISTLPVFVLDIIPSNSEQKVCLICMNDFEVGHEVRALPCCNFYLVHIFHTACTDNWLRRNKICPTCKTPCDGPRDYD